MATGSDLVAALVGIIERDPQLYYSQAEPRAEPDLTHHTDCSGFLCWAQNAVGVPFGENNSWGMAQLGHQLGLGVSRDYALTHPGCWGVIGANEGQTNIDSRGHIFATVGDGHRTVEARGRWAGVGIFDVESHEVVDYWMKAPSIDYELAAPAPKPLPKEEKHAMGMVEMPVTSQTPKGRAATAIVDFKHNRVALQDGARAFGDHPIDGQPHTHWWAPPDSERIPGWSIQELCRSEDDHDLVIVRYVWGEDNGGTYLMRKRRDV